MLGKSKRRRPLSSCARYTPFNYMQAYIMSFSCRTGREGGNFHLPLILDDEECGIYDSRFQVMNNFHSFVSSGINQDNVLYHLLYLVYHKIERCEKLTHRGFMVKGFKKMLSQKKTKLLIILLFVMTQKEMSLCRTMMQNLSGDINSTSKEQERASLQIKFKENSCHICLLIFKFSYRGK